MSTEAKRGRRRRRKLKVETMMNFMQDKGRNWRHFAVGMNFK
jgi:hypothetical protein